MFTLLVILIVIIAVLLTLTVLVQNSKGGGLASGFQSSNQYMGVRKTTDFLEKATWGLAGTMIVLAIIAVGIRSSNNSQETKSAIQEQSVDITRQVKEGTAVPNFGEVPEATSSENTGATTEQQPQQ